MRRDYNSLPDDLPVPEDHGAADDLPGAPLPALAFPSSQGGTASLDELGRVRAPWHLRGRHQRPEPRFPPDRDAGEVLAWLAAQPRD